MDAKVTAMIMLIEEDADSFARRAEMYYKKWPELMKLVEEFYRAYRALAERYDHTTGQLCQADRTMAECEPHRPEMPHRYEHCLEKISKLECELSCAQEEIRCLNSVVLLETTKNKRYQALMEQVESVGLNPKCIASSVRDLQDENTKLRQICKEDKDDKEALFKKLENMEQLLDKNVILESSLLDLSSELKGSQANVKALQESCQSLHGEKSALVSEKAAVLSESQIITDNMQKILEQNTVLENSLFGANVELEGLREKSKSLEELCSNTLVVQLDNVERRLENLEMRFAVLEQKYAGMEKEKESTLSQVEELKVSVGVEKQERASFALSSGARLPCLENHIQLLQEETRWRKKEFEELDKAMNAQFEIFVSQKFIQGMEQKNYTLLMECQKHVEASKLTEKLVLELESENPEQQVEAELLLDEIEKLRMGIYHQVFKALEIGLDNELDNKIANEQIFVHHIKETIEDMKCSLSNYEDDKQQLLVENSVLLTLVGQLRLEGVEFGSERKILEQEFKAMTEQLVMVQNEKHRLLEINRQSEVKMGDQYANTVKAEMEQLCMQKGDLQRAYLKLQGEYSQVLAENRSLLKTLSELKEEKCMAEEENNFILLETLALDNLSVIFKNFGTEKSVELKLLCEDVHNLHGVNSDLKKEVGVLGGELEMKETENLLLKDSMKKLEEELLEVRDFNNQLRHEISTGKNFLCQKEIKLLEAEEKLKATEDLNSELCGTVEGLKKQHEESILMKENLEKHIFELSKENASQNKEIECLREVNGNLDSELGILREDVEVHGIREENLNSKLQEIGNDFEMWEAEAATLQFDLQISDIREVLFENKFNELTGVCETLENENASKTVEIEQMKERVSFMETEIGGLKDQLFAYAPTINSLRDNIASLEHNVLSLPELNVADNQEQKWYRGSGGMWQLWGGSSGIEVEVVIAMAMKVVGSPDLSGDCVGRSGKFLGYSLLTQNGQQNTLVICPDLSGACLGRSGKFLGYSLLTQNRQQNTLVIFVRGAALDLQASRRIFLVNRFQSKESRGREDSDAHLVSRILGRPWHFQSNNTSQSKGQLCVVCLEDFRAEHKQVVELPCPINTTQNVSSRGSLLIRIAPAVKAPFCPN
ncbi:hypothetical protein TEA_023761 [Camellia sinensis var. sinensis]|uniref:NAB domain-containing protein n=1 Tax=Camellia sinensis var. sinensis TaxID=542762 RepID=A0A4S4DVB2_CAMSN|nr:hypothetical protein TEA_023761 [Camellia sinensis var. sinensis]